MSTQNLPNNPPRVAWHTGAALQDLDSSVLVFTGGLRAGKTFGGWFKHISLCAINSESPFSAFFEPIYSKIADTVIPIGRTVLGLCGYVEGVHYKITTSQPYPKITFLRSGQEIHLRSAENPDSIVAVEYSHVTADELALCKVEAYRNMRARMSCPKAKARQFVGLTAPQGVNWCAEEFDSEVLPGWDRSQNRDHTNPARKYRRFTLWTDDNPHLPPDYLDTLNDIFGHNPNLIQAYRYGKFCPLVEGAAYSNYAPQKHDLDDQEADPYRDIVLTWDFNANPLAWVAIQRLPDVTWSQGVENRKFRYVAIDEANEGTTQLDDACAEFSKKFPREFYSNARIQIYGDRSGHAGSHKIPGSDFDFIEGHLKSLGYRHIEIVASRLVAPEAASVEAVQKLFLNDLLFVTKKCRLLRKSLMATTWKEGTRKLDKPAGETHTHHGDAVKYWAWQETRDETGGERLRTYGVNL